MQNSLVTMRTEDTKCLNSQPGDIFVSENSSLIPIFVAIQGVEKSPQEKSLPEKNLPKSHVEKIIQNFIIHKFI